jgi:hypothetical protein
MTREEWDRDAMIKSAPKLNPSDVVILIQNHSEDAEKTAAEIRKIAGEVAKVLSLRPVPPIPAPR